MPTNLNALIRYKTIDKCLRNRSVKCSILRLCEECSEALGEKRGVYKTVSERTIRDDLRVMRSDILGFNAPIAFEDGCYFYTDKHYSIFGTSIHSRELLQSVFDLLWAQRDSMSKPLINQLLIRIARELEIALPPDSSADSLAERKGTDGKRAEKPNVPSPQPGAEAAQADVKKSAGRRKTDVFKSKIVNDSSDAFDSVLAERGSDVYESGVELQEVAYNIPWRIVFSAL